MNIAADIYRYPVDADSDSAAANVLRFVGKGRKVLEIGAGPGSVAKAMVDLNGCKVSAVEIDQRCVSILRTFCETVWRCDLNSTGWMKNIPARAFDNVVIADVLEHLVDPWKTLKIASTLIKKTGSVVVSMQNTSHAAVLACLMDNDFKYQDWGLLDRTHIRFFSIKNMQTLFEDAGLAVLDHAFIQKHPSETELANIWSELPGETKAFLESVDYANVYQVVVKAVPKDRATRRRPSHSLLEQPAQSQSDLRYVAFYLPQFHPIAENDAWWGKGFTEWTNVTKAKPLFPEHYQPHLPAELGFYDLRMGEVRREQISLARGHGIDAFCFHYYWFNGHRLLERPILDFLADKEADFDFCLCWANENWTRKWDGSDHEILIEQTYTPENDIAFIDSLLPFFRDRRYVRINGAPVLVVYRSRHLPDARATTAAWRDHCRKAGIGEIYLVAALTHGNEEFENQGFDAGVEFPPHNTWGTNGARPRNLAHEVGATVPLQGSVYAYEECAQSFIERDYSRRKVYRCVVPSWDNTARLGARAHIMHGSSPSRYEEWLHAASSKTIADRVPAERLVFINAWNEWAEGCHLEPDLVHGRAHLEATARAKAATARDASVQPPWSRRSREQKVPLELHRLQSHHTETRELRELLKRTMDEKAELFRIIQKCEHELERLRPIESSTIWRASAPIREILSQNPDLINRIIKEIMGSNILR